MNRKHTMLIAIVFVALVNACADAPGNSAAPPSNALNFEQGANTTTDDAKECAEAHETDTDLCKRRGVECGSVAGVDTCGVVRDVESCGVCPKSLACKSGRCVDLDSVGGEETVKSADENTGDAPSSDAPCADGAKEKAAEFCARNNVQCGAAAGEDRCGVYQKFDCGECSVERFCELGRCQDKPRGGSAIVEIDAFSGLPNPTYEISLDAAEELFATSCELLIGTSEPKESFYKGDPGYRGVIVRRPDSAPTIYVSKGVLFVAKDSPPVACLSQLKDADLVGKDPDSALEMQLVGLAFDNGVISAELFDRISGSIKKP